jgi:3-hydroxymyristoyl/3-hydroxydecanoyl-(acyl carrier protein) dehydratase
MQFSAEIWHQSENFQALGDISNLIGEKSPIWRQRVNRFSLSNTLPHIACHFPFLPIMTVCIRGGG